MQKNVKDRPFILYLGFALLAMLVGQSCEEPFEPDYLDEEPSIVIEGFIQAGDEPVPAYVIISKTYPLFQSADNPQTPQLYLGGATVTVTNNDKEVPLTEFCTDNLTPEQLELLKGFLNVDIIPGGSNLCFYVDITNALQAKAGETYDLSIDFEENLITASTTIPSFVEIDSLEFEENKKLPGFGFINAYIQDPVGPTFYRMLVSTNGGAFMGSFGTVMDDNFFDGITFDFPINKPFGATENQDPNTAGFFMKGDTVQIQWSLIDEAHFDFWNTLEYAQSNQGPFSSYSRATTNINGGIGVWGGYNRKVYEYIIEK